MSAMVLDKSLDSIIAEKKQGKRKGGNRRPGGAGAAHAAKAKLVGKGGVPANAAVAAAAKRRGGGGPPAPAATSTGPASQVAFKIIVSNLPLDVNDAQVKDLFASTVGATKSCQLQFNAAGKSTGTATVVFAKIGDAQKAFETYNNRLIDGKRPMKIEIVYDPAKQPLVNRVAAPKAAPVASTVAAAGGGGGARSARPTRGRGRGRGGKGGERSGKRAPKTAEDLDAEMADYTKEATTAPAA